MCVCVCMDVFMFDIISNRVHSHIPPKERRYTASPKENMKNKKLCYNKLKLLLKKNSLSFIYKSGSLFLQL